MSLLSRIFGKPVSEPDPRDVAQAEYRAATEAVEAAKLRKNTQAIHHARERQMEALHACLRVGA